MGDIWTELELLRRDGRAGVLATVVSCRGHVPTELGTKMLVGAGGRLAGTVGGGALEKLALETARRLLTDGKPLLKEFVLAESSTDDPGEATGMVCGGRVQLFFEPIGPGTTAYVFGAGHVGRALRDVLAPLGFAVTLIDSRAEQLADLDTPHLQAGPDYQTLPTLSHLAGAYVVVVTHSHVCDKRVLVQILESSARPEYLGVIASRRKSKLILASLADELGRDVDLDGVACPIGLYLGGNSPAAVALSIAAEMQAHRHGITGHVSMRDRAGDRGDG